MMPRYAQAKENVRVSGLRRFPRPRSPRPNRLNEELAGRARVLVRPSGTEPLVRVLGEAETDEEARNLCARIAALVQRELG